MSRKRQAEIPNPNSGGTQGGAVEAQIQGIPVGIQAAVQEEDPSIRKIMRAMTSKISFPALWTCSLVIAK